MNVYWLEIDDEVEEHLARHGVRAYELWEVLSNDHLTFPNRDEGEGRIYLLGLTHGGRLVKASLAKTDDEGTWRPVTAFTGSDADRKLFHRHL